MTKKTKLYDIHVALGAKVIEFGGWMMPVSYCSIIDEHKAVRENVGLFDVSHMGQIFVSGKDSCEFLNKLVPQSIDKLEDSKAIYCQMLNLEGGIIDDLIVYKLENQKYLVIVNASRIEDDYGWMVKQSEEFDVELDNKSDEYSMIAIQGPKATDLMHKLGIKKDSQPKFFHLMQGDFLGVASFIARTGYTGEDGFEIIINNESAEIVWNTLLDAGKEFSVKPIGLGARDTLRLEAALPLYGNDLDENTTPIEAGLAWSVAKDKVSYYNGNQVIQSQLKNGVEKKLIGFKMLDKSIPRHEYEVIFNGETVGHVTSGGVSPILGENIALAYVKNIKEICIGNNVQVKIREKLHDALVVKRPFVNKNYKI